MASIRKRKPRLVTEYLDENLRCNICNQRYEDPKLLPCLHTFCRTCLKTEVDPAKDSITCPICLTECELPPDGVDKFADNFLVLMKLEESRLDSKPKNFIPCVSCGDLVPAIARCINCNDYLCRDCVKAHRRVRFTKDHSIAKLQELKDVENQNLDGSKKRESLCNTHTENTLDLYCNSCETAICYTCAKSEIHSKHHHSPIDEVLDQHIPSLKTQLENTRERIPELQESLHQVIGRFEKYETEYYDLAREIRKRVQILMRALQDREEELLAEIRVDYDSKCIKFTEEKDRIQKTLVKVIDSCEFTEDILEYGSKAEILTVTTTISSRLGSLNNIDNGADQRVVEQFQHDVYRLAPEPIIAVINKFGTKKPKNRQSVDLYSSWESLPQVTNNINDAKIKKQTTGDNDPNKPIIGQQGGKPVGKTTATSFTVAVPDKKGRKRDIEFQLQSPDGTVLGAQVLDHKDGFFTVFYCPRAPGEHNMFVRVGGKHVTNSQRVLNFYGKFGDMKKDELHLIYKALSLIRWQVTPGLLQVKGEKIVPGEHAKEFKPFQNTGQI